MADDSGAFKTNQANSRPIPAFYRELEAPLQPRLTGPKNRMPSWPRRSQRRYLTNVRESVAVFSNQPDSRRGGGGLRVANAHPVVTAFPNARKAFASPARRRNPPLPCCPASV